MAYRHATCLKGIMLDNLNKEILRDTECSFFYITYIYFFIKHRLSTCITRLINVKMKGREASLRTKRRTKQD